MGDRFANGPDEAHNVNENSAYVRCITAPVKAKREVVRGRSVGRVEVFDLIVTTPNHIVVADDDTCNGGEEHGIGAQISDEIAGRGEKVPAGKGLACIRDQQMACTTDHGHMARPTAAQM